MLATLLSVPITIAIEILEKLDPMDRLACRKVCRCLRTASDRFGASFRKVKISFLKDYICIWLDETIIMYTHEIAGVSVTHNQRKTTINQEQFIGIVLKDFDIVSSRVPELEIKHDNDDRQDIDAFLMCISKREKCVNLKRLMFERLSINDILFLIPFFNFQVLQFWYSDTKDRFERITHLNQWGNTKSFGLWDSALDSKLIERLFHFETISVGIRRFTVKTAIKIRDNLLKRSTFKQCIIRHTSRNYLNLAKVFKPDYVGDKRFKARLLPEQGSNDIGKAYQYLFHRIPRATNDGFKSSLTKMQMISRITTGIYLQHGLSTGSITSDDLIPELLHFGSITPTQISAINTDKLSKIVEGINELPGKLESSVIQLEDQLLMFASVNEKVKGVVPGSIILKDDAYKTQLDALKLEDWRKVDSFAKGIVIFLNEMESMEGVTSDDSANIELSDMASHLPKFKYWTLEKYNVYAQNQHLRNIHISYPSLNLVYKAVAEFFPYKNSLDGSLLSKVQENINHLSKLAVEMKLEAPMISQLHKMFLSRSLKNTDNIKFISGLLNGISDIQMIFNDLRNDWVNETVAGQAYNLVKALNQLKTLASDAKTVEQSIRSDENQIHKDVSDVYQKVNHLADIADIVKPLVDTVSSISFPKAAISAPEVQKIGPLITNMKLLSSKLGALETLVKLSRTLQREEYKIKLDEIINIAKATENTLDRFQKKIEKDFGEISTFVNGLQGFLDGFAFLKNIQGIDSLKPVIEVIRSYRDSNTKSTVSLSTLKTQLPMIKNKLRTLDVYIKKIKNSKHMETEALSAFTSIAVDSQMVGMATRGITDMQRMGSQTVDLKPLKDWSARIEVEMKKHELDPADVKNLKSLAGLETELNRIKKEAGTFIQSVAPVNSNKLSDYSGIFQKAKSVKGINIDLPAIIGSVENLKTRLPSTRRRRAPGVSGVSISQLDNLLKLLKSLQVYDSTKFVKAFDGSAKSLQVLDGLFLAYASTLTRLKTPGAQPLHANPGNPANKPTAPGGNKGAASPSATNYHHSAKADAEMGFLENNSPWSYIGLSLIVCSFVALFVYIGLWFYHSRKVKLDVSPDLVPLPNDLITTTALPEIKIEKAPKEPKVESFSLTLLVAIKYVTDLHL
ncbi:F-box domain-containing protein [Caenorhabditis elegans]|uniref:F-box domain-containing protein n=1 Tax=Caenorhabditis elegans TaxID=6239 RepID=Q9BKX2_CAEEL|nr:F-box domain-containing protein [Caenorhabditis elegans]CCD73771.1 F-box domain-containing protein [Caenorhabditis elegans]|eukprot:NP_497449.2 Uncharacterized protein CELE_Y22D7AR.2 [Caenorhabditis elegans]